MDKAVELKTGYHRVHITKKYGKIANNLPTNAVQLFSLKGIGHSKLEKFGDEILDIIIAYCVDKNFRLKHWKKGFQEIN